MRKWRQKGCEGQIVLFASDERIVLSRYLASGAMAPLRRRATGELRALVLIVNPTNLADFRLAPVDVAAESSRARVALSALNPTIVASGQGGPPIGAGLIAERARDGYDVIALVAHGGTRDGEPFLMLEGTDGRAAPTPAATLVEMLSQLVRRPTLVVLASCQSAGDESEAAITALGPQLLRAGVPAVLAMQGNISMIAIARMLPAFWSEIQRDGQIDRAIAAARALARDLPDWWRPVLFSRLRDGLIWDAVPAQPVIAAQPPAKAPNPFGRQGRMNDDTAMFGREHVISSLFEELSKGVSVSLVGERQSGKTTLLHQVQRLGPQRLHLPPDAFIYLNMQLVDNEGDFFEALCAEMGLETLRGARLWRALRGRQYVVCLDEVEKMTSASAFSGMDVALQMPPGVDLGLVEFKQVSATIREYHQATAPSLKRNLLLQATSRIEQATQIAQDIEEPFGSLLRLIADRWRPLIAEESGRLARADIGGPIPNPYVAGNPVRGDLFVGREDVMRRLRELWAGPYQRPSVILFGHRRMGKSSILRNLGQWLNTDTTVVDFNLQRISLVDSSNDLLYTLAQTLFDALPTDTKCAIGEPDESRFLDRSPYTALDQYLRLVGAHHNGRRFIIAIDEFEKIEEWIAAGRIEPQLLDALRGQIQTHPWLVLALAGLHTLEEMTHDYWNPLFGSVTAIPVSFLSPEGARRLITQPSPDFAINYSPEAINQIVSLTSGQPYLVQLIGHALVTRFNRQTFEAGIERERRFTYEDVEAVIDAPEFHRDGHAYFDGVWNQARQSRPAGQPEILRALATARDGLGEQVIANHAGLSTPEVQAISTTLIAHDVVRRDGDRLCYTVELMRRWVAAL